MFQGVQSPWPRPNASSRSPNASAIRPAAARCSSPPAMSIRPSSACHHSDAASAHPLDRRPQRQLARRLRRRLRRDVGAAAHRGHDRRDRQPVPVAGVQELRNGKCRRPRRRQLAQRVGLGGDERTREVVPAHLGVRHDPTPGRRHLHHRLPVRPGGADTHREIGAGQLERAGEVVRQHQVGQIGVADPGRHRDRGPPAEDALGHAGPERSRRGRRGEASTGRCAIGELCDRGGAGAGRRGRRQDLRAVASTGAPRSARSPANPAELARLQPVRGRRRRSGRGCRHRRFSPRHRTGSCLRGAPDRVDAPTEGGTIGVGGQRLDGEANSPTTGITAKGGAVRYRAFPTGPCGSIADDPRGFQRWKQDGMSRFR